MFRLVVKGPPMVACAVAMLSGFEVTDWQLLPTLGYVAVDVMGGHERTLARWFCDHDARIPLMYYSRVIDVATN